MSKKARTFQRPLGERRYKKLFVVSVEGSKTEPQYFVIFNQSQSIVLVKCLKRPSTESSPIQVLKKMQGYLRKESLRKTDEAWIVVDKDDWQRISLESSYSGQIKAKTTALLLETPTSNIGFCSILRELA
jgi:hypothetical protein